jgi:ABC-2 type transport system ATP-binding protein
MENHPAIQINNLKKSFAEFQAVKGIDLIIQRGEILSLLGPNGAGKSTTISMLCGLLEPTEGDALILGHSIRSESAAARAVLGVVPQDIALYPDMSARENLLFWGKMYNLRGALLKERVAETLDMIGLADRQNDKVGTFSGGMKRRVNIAAALLHHPQIVIMDEPTVGIDPQSRRHILDNVKALNKLGMTVLYTTHYMEEAQELSNHIAIMDTGRMVAYGTHTELLQMVGELTRIDLQINVEPQLLLPQWQQVTGIEKITPDHNQITILVKDSNQVLPHLFEIAGQQGARITAVDIFEPNLEAVFLHLTGKALRD